MLYTNTLKYTLFIHLKFPIQLVLISFIGACMSPYMDIISYCSYTPFGYIQIFLDCALYSLLLTESSS